MQGLRSVLEANRRVYFDGMLAGFDALYRQSIESLVGPDYRHLKGRLDKASTYRNKIFHGQLTADKLSRRDLLGLVDDIRGWCGKLAEGALQELGYDGFGRNSFRKSGIHDLWHRCQVEFKGIGDYEAFIRRYMQR